MNADPSGRKLTLEDKVDNIWADVLVIKTELKFTYNVVFPMIIGAISLVVGVFVGALMVHN